MDDKRLYPLSSFPADVWTPEQAIAAGIAPVPGAEAYEIVPVARMTFQQYLNRGQAECAAVRNASEGRFDA